MQLINDLTDLHSKLFSLREYISKLGPERRKTELGIRKYNEACIEYNKLDYILSHVKSCIEKSEVNTSDLTIINNLVNQIHILFNKINILSCPISTEQKMATDKFDIKTAISLLPVMTGQETVTKSLIDGIELYSSMISPDTHSQLIQFVLKTRLSASAKLRLNTEYDTIKNLLTDLNKYTLPKKSPVSLQSKLQSCKQGSRSIEAFGTELENIFVNLTLAQADGDSTKYSILRPLNEKVAIKRFADGLSDQRLSTIIASRQFDSLSESIRTALDEQSMSTDNHVMSFNRFSQNRQNFNRGNRGNYSRDRYYYNNNHNKNSQKNPSWQNRQGNTRPTHTQTRGQRGHVSQGRGAARGTRARPAHGKPFHSVQHATHEEPVDLETNTSDLVSNEFFRS